VLLDVEPTTLLRMAFDPEVDPELDWHIVREAGEIRFPVWAVREMLEEGRSVEPKVNARRERSWRAFYVSRSAASASAARIR
jgi:hypothetical protein